MAIRFDDTNANVRAYFRLDSTPYPYPSGSWNDYINYVKTAGSISSAGYRNRYGYLTLVNYWLESKPMYRETPDLWQTSEQPITAVKESRTPPRTPRTTTAGSRTSPA